MTAETEALEIDALAGGEEALLFAENCREHQVVIAVGENGGVAGEEFGEGAVFIDGEVVDDRLHGEGYAAG